MTETEESAMEDKNNITSNITSHADTDAEPQEDLCQKGEPEFHRLALVWV